MPSTGQYATPLTPNASDEYVEARDNYSTCWNKGGPIIEREHYDHRWLPKQQEWCVYRVRHGVDGHVIGSNFGPTLLIAAMRCFVASKLGDEVDVPKELV